MKNRIRSAALAVLTPLLTACLDNPFGVTCTTEAVPALHVVVSDARTGAFVSGGYTVVARAGAFADSVSVPEDGGWWDPARGVSLAHERAGRYEVAVRKAGYAEWGRNGVRVTRDECHVRTVRLEARLEPLP